jgi:hypothetical protein
MQPQPSGLSTTTLRQHALAGIATFPGGPGGLSHLRTGAAMVAAGGGPPPHSVHVAPSDAVGKADHVLPRQLQGGNEFVSHSGCEVGGCRRLQLHCGAAAAAALWLRQRWRPAASAILPSCPPAPTSPGWMCGGGQRCRSIKLPVAG